MSTATNIWIKVIQQINNHQQPDPKLLAQLSVEERELIEDLQKDQLMARAGALATKVDEQQAWTAVRAKLTAPTVKLFPRIARYAAAVLLPLIMIAGGIFYYNVSKQPVELALAQIEPTDHNRATLILADGSSVALGEKANQQLTTIAGTRVTNADKSVLSYHQNNDTQVASAVYNKLVIPRGAEYTLALADGSIIKINSASVLRFPVNINADESREVFLEQGEAYFKVAKNPAKPFIVHANNMNVKVLGTTFNVNTYKKNVQATLVEGKVEAKGDKQGVILAPNQQATFNATTGSVSKADVDITPIVAWANGKIIFEENTLDEVMEELGLWYDYDVAFVSAKIRNTRFSGEIEKYKDIKQILSIIEQTGGVKFSIKNRRIYVDAR